jgi:signal peptidase I
MTMGLKRDLELCSKIEDYQRVFDNEVSRFRNMTLYKNDSEKLNRRIIRLKKDIEYIMSENGIEGYLKVRDAEYSSKFKDFTFKFSDFNYKNLMLYLAPLILVIGVLITIGSVFQFNKVDGHSMDPTLSNGSYLIVNRYSKIERFDIVVAKEIDKSGNTYSVVKRVIGMPGDVIEYKSDVLYVNGEKYEESYLNDYLSRWRDNKLEDVYSYNESFVNKARISSGFTTQEFDLVTKELNDVSTDFKVEVPTTGYFLIGDNRLVSKDSRDVGAFPIENVVGKVVWTNS